MRDTPTIVAEDSNNDVAKSDAEATHFTVFRGHHDWAVLATLPTRAAAEAWLVENPQ